MLLREPDALFLVLGELGGDLPDGLVGEGVVEVAPPAVGPHDTPGIPCGRQRHTQHGPLLGKCDY